MLLFELDCDQFGLVRSFEIDQGTARPKELDDFICNPARSEVEAIEKGQSGARNRYPTPVSVRI